MQSTPLKKKKSIIQKIVKFFNDIPDQQIAVINEASQKLPPQIKKSQSLQDKSQKNKKQDPKHKYSEELFEELHEVNRLDLGE